jgi:hypothetical protein
MRLARYTETFMKGTNNKGATKHYDLELKWLQQLDVASFAFKWGPTENQLADFLTKPLPKQPLRRFQELCKIG